MNLLIMRISLVTFYYFNISGDCWDPTQDLVNASLVR